MEHVEFDTTYRGVGLLDGSLYFKFRKKKLLTIYNFQDAFDLDRYKWLMKGEFTTKTSCILLTFILSHRFKDLNGVGFQVEFNFSNNVDGGNKPSSGFLKLERCDKKEISWIPLPQIVLLNINVKFP